MRFLYTLLLFFFTGSLFGQSIDILIKESEPYYLNDTINIEIYLTNNTNSLLTYFDSRGSSWNSFKETWELNVTSQVVEVLPLNNSHTHNFPDSTIITIQPGDTNLIRTHLIALNEVGYYSLTYTQQQGAHLVQKRYADSDSTHKKSQTITTFEVLKNLKFEVQHKYDTTIHELINMSWGDWKEFRHTKVYSQKKHFRNLDAAFLYPQDVYSLAISCNGLDIETIKRIGQFKNLRSLALRYYELDVYPQELAELDLYELIIETNKGIKLSFPGGISQDCTLRELKGYFNNGVPGDLLNQKHLINLDIGDCDIDTIPNLSSLQNLKVLIANNTNIKSIDSLGVNQLPKLKELDLSGNKNINSLNPILGSTNLEFLVINRTRIDSIPHEIENMSKLKKLSISNKLTMVTDSLGNLSDMRYLSLGGNRSLSYFPPSILKMKKLLHLDISNTKIEKLPEGISELPLEKVLIYGTDCEVSKDYKALRKRLDENFKE